MQLKAAEAYFPKGVNPPTIHPDNEDVMRDGSCPPWRLWKNIRKYGHASPRQEFVESIEPRANVYIAKRWKVSPDTVDAWRRRQGWDQERERFWERVNLTKSAIMEGDLGSMQADEISERIGLWRALRGALGQVLEKGYIEDMSASGYLVKRGYNPRDLKDVATVMEKIDNGIGTSIGLSKAVLRSSDGKGDGEVRSVKRMVYNVRVVEEEEVKEPPALVEGHVIEAVESDEEDEE